MERCCSCEFLLSYEEEDDVADAGARKKSKKKKPWRFRWPDEVHARLLELNESKTPKEANIKQNQSHR